MAHLCQFHQQLEAPCLSMGMGFGVGTSISSPGSMGQRPHGYCPPRAQYVLAGSKTLKVHLFTIYPTFMDHTLDPGPGAGPED